MHDVMWMEEQKLSVSKRVRVRDKNVKNIWSKASKVVNDAMN